MMHGADEDISSLPRSSPMVWASTGDVETVVVATRDDVLATESPDTTQDGTAAAVTSEPPLECSTAASRQGTSYEVSGNAGSVRHTASGDAAYEAHGVARERTAGEFAAMETSEPQSFRKTGATARIMSGVTISLPLADSYRRDVHECGSEGGVVNRNTRSSNQQLRDPGHLPVSSECVQPTAAAGEGSRESHASAVKELLRGSTYENAPCFDRGFYSRSNSGSSIDGLECVSDSLTETRAKPLPAARLLNSVRHGQKSPVNDCSRRHSRDCEAAYPSATCCTSPPVCKRYDAADTAGSLQNEDLRPSLTTAHGSGASVDEASTALLAEEDADMQLGAPFCAEQRDALREQSCLATGSTVHAEVKRVIPATSQLEQVDETAVMEKGGRLIHGRASGSSRAYESWHLQLKQQLQLQREAGQLREAKTLMPPLQELQEHSWRKVNGCRANTGGDGRGCPRSGSRQGPAASVARGAASCCSSAGEMSAAGSVQGRQTGLYICAEERARGNNMRLVQAGGCYLSNGGRRHTPLRIPILRRPVPPLAAENAASWCAGGQQVETLPGPDSGVRGTQSVPTPAFLPACHGGQAGGISGMDHSGEFPLLPAPTDLVRLCTLEKPTVAQASRRESVFSPTAVGRSSTVCRPLEGLHTLGASTFLHDNAGQKTFTAEQCTPSSNSSVHASAGSLFLDPKMHLTSAVADGGGAVPLMPPVTTGLRERPGVAPALTPASATQGQEQMHLYRPQLSQQHIRQGFTQQQVQERLLQEQQNPEQVLHLAGSGLRTRGRMQQGREIMHDREQAATTDVGVCALSRRSADGSVGGDVGRQTLTAALGWGAVAATSGTNVVDAREPPVHEEVAAPVPCACPVDASVCLAHVSAGETTPVRARISERKAQHSEEESGVEGPQGQTLVTRLQSYPAVSPESFTQEPAESLERRQQTGLLHSQEQQKVMSDPQRDSQPRVLWGPYNCVPKSVNGRGNTAESVPFETTAGWCRETASVEVSAHVDWGSAAVRTAGFEGCSGDTTTFSPCSSSVTTLPCAHEPTVFKERLAFGGPQNAPYSGHGQKTAYEHKQWKHSLCLSTHVGSHAPGVPSATAGAALLCGQAGCPGAVACACSLVHQPAAGMALLVPRGVLHSPVQLLHTVGVVGAAPPAFATAANTDSGEAPVEGKEMGQAARSATPRHGGRSQSVLKRAASADSASGRFTKTKTVSFADLNEYDHGMAKGSSSSLQATGSRTIPSASLPLGLTSSASDTSVAKEFGKSSAGTNVRDAGRRESPAGTRRVVGGAAEPSGTDVAIDVHGVGSGNRHGPAVAAAQEGRSGAGDSVEDGRKAEASIGQRIKSALMATLARLAGKGRDGNALAATVDLSRGERYTPNGGAGVFARRLRQTSSSGSISSGKEPVSRGGEAFVGKENRQGPQSGSGGRSGLAEDRTGSGSEGEEREGDQRRRRRASNRWRRQRGRGGNGGRGGRNRGSRSPGERPARSSGRSRSAESTPSSGSIVARASSRLSQLRLNLSKAFQDLVEHDTAFRMSDELFSHEAGVQSRGPPIEQDVSASAASVGSVATGGGSPSASGGGGATAGGTQQGVSVVESPRGGGGEGSVCRSVSSDVLLRRLPLKFMDRDLEDLFAGNINQWMTTRLLLMGVLMLLVTSLMWPLMSWSFNLQDAFNHSEPIGVLFHIDMSLNVIVAVLFITIRFSKRLTRHAELIGDAGTFLVVTIWGIWNTIASFILERSYVRDVVHPQMGERGEAFVSLEKTTSWSSAQEASSAVAYLHGLLLIVQLDVVYPSRTRRTWQIHLMFFILSSSSIIVRGAINPNFVPIPFVVIRVATYLMLTIFLYVGRHATELQQRHLFYNWLMTRKRMARLESDLKRHKESGKVSTAVEQLVDLIKQCKDTFQSLDTGIADLSPFHRMQLDECGRTLDRCLLILTNTTNLYTVQFGELDSDTHREIVRAFLNTHSSSPAEWIRMAREAFTKVPDSIPPYISALSKTTFRPSPGIPGTLSRDVTIDVRPPPETESYTPDQGQSALSYDISDAGPSSPSSRGSAHGMQSDNALVCSVVGAGVGTAAASPARVHAVVPGSPVTAPVGESTITGDEVYPPELQGDTVIKVIYSCPRGIDFADDEVVVLQLQKKRTLLHDGSGEAPNATAGASEYGSKGLSLTAEDDSETGAQESRPGIIRSFSPEKSAVVVRDKDSRSKESSDAKRPLVKDEVAREGAIRTATQEDGTSVSGDDRGDDRMKDGVPPKAIPFPESRGTGLPYQKEQREETIPRESDFTAAAGGFTGRRPTRLAVAERGGPVAMTSKGKKEAAANQPQGRRWSCTVAPDEGEDSNTRRAPLELPCPSARAASVYGSSGGAVTGDVVYRAFVMDQRACREMKARNEAIARILSLPLGSPELNPVQRLSEEEVQSWKFDCLMFAKKSPAPLVEVGHALLARPCENLVLPSKEVLVRFLKAVEAQYTAVPYHNSIHGFMVAQKMVALTRLLNLTNKVSSRDLAVMVVAGLCHDIGHPGRNNALLINAIDPVAVLYNDKSVLENYHSCLTFKTLDLPECDVFGALRNKRRREYHVVRSLIIELILATDMKNHFETLSRFRVRRLAADFDISGEEDLWFLLKIVIKCADLSHCGVSWSEHFEWCLRLCTEFYDQGDEELARHLPVSPLCEREKHSEIAKAQLGFMNFVTIPLYEELVAVDATGTIESSCIALMKTNVKHWEMTASAGVAVPLYGKDIAADMQPPFAQLLDQNQHSKPEPGSKAAEIANHYVHVNLTCVDLTPLVMRTQLSRGRRDSRRLMERVRDAQGRRTGT